MKNLISTKGYLFIVSIIGLQGCGERSQAPPLTNTVASKGELIVKENCKVCHAQGINGAPILGNKKMWSSRLPKGVETLARNAISGVGLMPPKGGKTELSDDEVLLAVEYMVSKAI